MDRLVLTARLKPDGRRRALTLLGEHSVLDVGELEIYVERHTIFLTETEVIFLFEGKEAEQAVRALLDDPVRSALIGHWLPLFDGPLRRAQEAYSWGAEEMV